MREERLYKIIGWLRRGHGVSRDFMLRELGVSLSTLKRDLQYLGDRLNTPVAWDAGCQGWRLDREAICVGGSSAQIELPGLWFSADELIALLTMQHLLTQIDASGLLGHHIEPMTRRLAAMVDSGVPAQADIARRIRVITLGSRRMAMQHFQAVGGALLRRLRLFIRYHHRVRGDSHEREVSPQRLVHYRDNWYLDAWCHWRGALRSFSVDSIGSVQVLDKPAIDITDGELDDVLGSGYGIFAGKDVVWARLRFSAERSRWVAAERWHPRQRGRLDAEGRWTLDIPYADPRELVMDLLRHVPDVEVMWPEELQQMVRERLEAALRTM